MTVDHWARLEELVQQNQFELLPMDANGSLRLVYLMNDAVESFLVFREASLTGSYISDFEGDIWVDYDDVDTEEKRSYLILHQEENVVTIFFTMLDFEVHLYDYSRVGHFWVAGYEYLRQLEFKIAILSDKYTYIGPNACTEQERELAKLIHFPPLGYCCYPAVSEKYIVPREDPWTPTDEAIQVMIKIAEKAGDSSYMKWLQRYRCHPSKWMTRLLAAKLHTRRHIRITKLLMELFVEACNSYPLRYRLDPAVAGYDTRPILQKLRRAEDEQRSLRAKQIDSEIYVEEPFCFGSDGIEAKVYLAVWHTKGQNLHFQIEELNNDV